MSELLETIEVETGKNPTAAVIWMHGLGADGNDFVPVVPELGLADSGPVRFVFPNAPMRAVTINNGYVMRAWYDIVPGDLEGNVRVPDAEGIRASQVQIEALIAREAGRGIPARRVVLAGFSQGGAITLQAGLRHPDRLAGLLVLSSYLPLAEAVAAEAAPANRDVPVFMAHGAYDPVIPLDRAVRSRDALQQLGYAIDWHEYPMQHSVCMEEIQAIGTWLRQVLK
ncbi:MAG: alpha/beta hydrolase [Burkholderiales bacterium]